MIEDIGTDELLGYQDGQRMAHANPSLRGEGLKNVGVHRLQDASHLLNLNEVLFLKGFQQGYQDEMDGTAHPLPQEEQHRNVTPTPKIGYAITFRLRPAEQPVDPLRLWHGVVEQVHTPADWYIVRLLDEGYEGIRELVLPFQIVEVFRFFPSGESGIEAAL